MKLYLLKAQWYEGHPVDDYVQEYYLVEAIHERAAIETLRHELRDKSELEITGGLTIR
jgi:hypothetical protein